MHRIGTKFSNKTTEVKPFHLSFEDSVQRDASKPAMIVKVNYAPGKCT